MKNTVKLDNYYTIEELEKVLKKFVDNYNNQRYHESLRNLSPTDVYYGRGDQIIQERQKLIHFKLINEILSKKKSKLV